MFNFWRRFDWFKPKEEGWYQCTVRHGIGLLEPIVMDLYWYRKPDVGWVWIDKRRVSVFNGYKVYKSGRGAIEDNRVFEDKLCERNDIIAWRKLPKPFKEKGVKKIE